MSGELRQGRVCMPAGKGGTGLAATALLALVHIWQLLLRPVLGNNCRFEPGCSDYALEALRRHGARRGASLAAWRVLRCHPLCAGGHDPVPPPRSSPVSFSPALVFPAQTGSHRKPC